MGVVKYTGPVASFHCPTNAEIRSLKVHFSPKQEGTGDPSPENIREIVGWDGVEVYKTSRNLFDENTIGFINNKYVQYETGVLISWGSSWYVSGYMPIKESTSYTLKCRCTGLNTAGLAFYDEDQEYISGIKTNKSSSEIFPFTTPSKAKYLRFSCIEPIKYPPMIVLGTLSEEIRYEPYSGSTTNYEFGVLGKNKLPITANMEIKSINTDYNNTLQRDMTPGILYPNVSSNNYWLGTSAKTFVQEVQNGSITFQASGNSYGMGTIVPVQPQATYTISYTASDNQVMIRIGYYDADGYFTGTHGVVNNGASFTIPNNVYHMIIVAVSNTDYYNQLITVSNLQLELGSTATAYEPYDPKSIVYGGWMDLITGEVCEEYTLLSKPWSEWGNSTTFEDGTELRYENFGTPVKGNGISNFKTSLCNVAKYVYGNNNGNVHYYIVGNSYNCRVYLPIGTNENTQIQVLGELVTPITYHLAPTQLQTFLGQNNVWSNADYVEVEYDLHETQDILNRKAFIIANQPHIVKPAAVSLQNFKTDLVAPLKECKVHFEPIQEGSGDPSPSNIRPITGRTGCSIYLTGKNLLNQNDCGYNEGNGIVFGGTASSSRPDGTLWLPAGTYTLSASETMMLISAVKANSSILKNVFNTNTSTFTLTEGQNMRLLFMMDHNVPDMLDYNYQLELGSTNTPYVPYSGSTIPINWTTEAGTVYGGYVDLVKGELVATHALTTPNTNNWSVAGNNTYQLGHLPGDISGHDIDWYPENILCSHNKWSSSSYIHVNGAGQLMANKNFWTNAGLSTINDSTISAYCADQVNNGTPIQVSYKLLSPITYQLTPTQLKSLHDVNNIWPNTNGNIELAYWSH